MRTIALICLLPFIGQYSNSYGLGTPALTFDTTNLNFCVLSNQAAKKATRFARASSYHNAVASIKKARLVHNTEHVISFGRDTAGNTINSLVGTGSINSGYIPGIKNRFADIHIHTNEQPPSSGDLYGFIDQIAVDSNYIRYIITPMGQAYALVLISKEEALRFNTTYARRAGIQKTQSNGNAIRYQPTFPQQLVDELNEVRAWHEASPEAALVFLLKKYKTGIALLKQNIDGIYTALDVSERTDNIGNKTIVISACNQ